MKLFKVLVLPLFLISCSSNPPGADNYFFGRKQYEKEELRVKVVPYKDAKTLQRVAATEYKIQTAGTVVAFSVLKGNTCTIHMMDPSVKYQPEFIGHEFLHCVYGQWHTDNNSNS